MLLLSAFAMFTSACGVLPGSGGGSGSDKGPASALGQDFTLTPTSGGKRVLGHGFTFVVPSDWTPYGPEKTIYGGMSREWAVQAAAPKDPFVPYVSISAAYQPGKKQNIKAAMALFTGVQKLRKEFHIVDEGDVSVAGAQKAHRIHFLDEKDVTLPGESAPTHLKLETASYFINMPGGELTIVRFIAPQGHFGDGHFDEIEKSLVVHVASSGPKT